jgi:hypothetical protein
MKAILLATASAVAALVSTITATSAEPGVFARRGADDPAGHVRREDRGRNTETKDLLILARRGADDPAGHVRREDRGRNHSVPQALTLA